MQQNSLLKQQLYSGVQPNSKVLTSSGSLEMSKNRSQNSRSMNARERGKDQLDHGGEVLIYANQGASASKGVHLRSSSAIRHQQHQ